MSDDIFKQLETIKNSEFARPEWRAATKRNVRAYMHAHPQVRATPFRYLFRFAPAMLAGLVLFVTSGVSLASKAAVPGDFLYPWKVDVIENVESAFVVGTQDRAEFEVGRTTRRLQEVTELSARKTSPQVIAQARQRLATQITLASVAIDVAATEDNEQALQTAVKLGATLQVHSSVLTTLEASAETDAKPQLQDTISSLETTNTEVQGTIEELKVQQKQDSDAKPKEDLKAESATKLTASQDKLDAVWKTTVELDEGSELRIKAELLLSSAQNALLAADDDRAKEEYGDALTEIQTADQLITEATVFIQTSPIPSASPLPSPLPSPTASPLAPTPSDMVP